MESSQSMAPCFLSNRQLAEIGIGFCNDAFISDSFMETETVVNTCLFALEIISATAEAMRVSFMVHLF